ncbi:MAG: hypothetical protein ABEK50_17085 [bacterium]
MTDEEATNPLESLASDGELNESTLKDKAKKVRRTLRSTNHFSRQDRPLKRAEGFVIDSLERLRNLSAFQTAVEDQDWSDLVQAPEGVAQSIEPFLSFYRSHGKLPDIELDEALAYVLYVGVVKGEIFLGTDLQLSTDTPRGSYS